MDSALKTRLPPNLSRRTHGNKKLYYYNMSVLAPPFSLDLCCHLPPHHWTSTTQSRTAVTVVPGERRHCICAYYSAMSLTLQVSRDKTPKKDLTRDTKFCTLHMARKFPKSLLILDSNLVSKEGSILVRKSPRCMPLHGPRFIARAWGYSCSSCSSWRDGPLVAFARFRIRALHYLDAQLAQSYVHTYAHSAPELERLDPLQSRQLVVATRTS